MSLHRTDRAGRWTYRIRPAVVINTVVMLGIFTAFFKAILCESSKLNILFDKIHTITPYLF
ncbi:MAG: hypothetical protein IIY00_05645, partial [Clostridia bacterium]|nr:hypothetical protein [Clostridia bacterium]